MSVDFRTSLFFVADVKVSRQFYEGLLGQKVVEDFGECVGFAGGFSIMQRDAVCRAIFGRTFEFRKLSEGGHRLELYFETEDVAGLYARLRQADVPTVHDIEEQPWGQRVFRVLDPDGTIVEFGEPMAAFIMRFYRSGMTVEQVSTRCHTPVDMVRRIVTAGGG